NSKSPRWESVAADSHYLRLGDCSTSEEIAAEEPDRLVDRQVYLLIVKLGRVLGPTEHRPDVMDDSALGHPLASYW
ncbi:MAG: hypothetical protein ACE5D3_04930, partial [Candidatus Binatia bacterium]